MKTSVLLFMLVALCAQVFAAQPYPNPGNYPQPGNEPDYRLPDPIDQPPPGGNWCGVKFVPDEPAPAQPAAPAPKRHKNRDRLLKFAAVAAVGVGVTIYFGHKSKASKVAVRPFATASNGERFEFSRSR